MRVRFPIRCGAATAKTLFMVAAQLTSDTRLLLAVMGFRHRSGISSGKIYCRSRFYAKTASIFVSVRCRPTIFRSAKVLIGSVVVLRILPENVSTDERVTKSSCPPETNIMPIKQRRGQTHCHSEEPTTKPSAIESERPPNILGEGGGTKIVVLLECPSAHHIPSSALSR